MSNKEWKVNDPILVNLTPEEAVDFSLEIFIRDQKWASWHWLSHIVTRAFFTMIILYAWFILIPEWKLSLIIQLIGTATVSGLSAFVFDKLTEGLQRVVNRSRHLENILQTSLAHTPSPGLLPRLLQARPILPQRLTAVVDTALECILIRMSGDAVFALPFELRAELAKLVEKTRPFDSPQTPETLSIVILLALTSARDGNVQPVLRRLSKDSSTPRLREVAAECLREFSVDDRPME